MVHSIVVSFQKVFETNLTTFHHLLKLIIFMVVGKNE
jgi:hypothetical protein